MGLVRCHYCNWIREEPGIAEYSTDEEYEAAVREFHDSHDNPERNICPLPD